MGYTLKLVETFEDKADDVIDLISGAEGFRLNEEGLELPEPPSIWTEVGESFRRDGSILGAQKYENREAIINLFMEGGNKGDLILKLQRLQEFTRRASYYQKNKTGNYKNYAGDGLAHRIELRYALSDLPETVFGRGITRYEIINGNVEIPSNLHSSNLTADQIDSIKLYLTLKPFGYGKIMPIGKGYATSWNFDNILVRDNAITFQSDYLTDIKYPSFIHSELTNEGTISLWFRPIADSGYEANRFFLFTNLGASGHRIYFDTTNNRFYFVDGTNSVYIVKTFVEDELIHIVARWHADPDRIKISINGTHASTSLFSPVEGLTHCHIGGTNNHALPAHGHIYDFRAWDIELSDSQAEQVYKEGVGRTLLPLFDRDVIDNHDDSGHSNYFNILGVPGDVPAGALISLNNTSGSGKHIKTVRISQRTWGSVDKFRHIWEGEDRTGDTGGTWTPSVDASSSGGYHLPIIISTPGTIYGCYWQKTDYLLDNEGVFQVFARVAMSSASADFRVGFGPNEDFKNEWVTSDYAPNKWHLVDLGEVPYSPRDICYESDRYYIKLYFDCRSESAQTVYSDYLVLFPKRLMFGAWEAGVSLLSNTWGIAFETFDYQQMWQMIYTVGANNFAWPVSGEGIMKDIYLEPRIPNHFRIIADRHPTDTHINYIDDQFTLQKPSPLALFRYLFME